MKKKYRIAGLIVSMESFGKTEKQAAGQQEAKTDPLGGGYMKENSSGLITPEELQNKTGRRIHGEIGKKYFIAIHHIHSGRGDRRHEVPRILCSGGCPVSQKEFRHQRQHQGTSWDAQ